jgi:hypothetical protein
MLSVVGTHNLSLNRERISHAHQRTRRHESPDQASLAPAPPHASRPGDAPHPANAALSRPCRQPTCACMLPPPPYPKKGLRPGTPTRTSSRRIVALAPPRASRTGDDQLRVWWLIHRRGGGMAHRRAGDGSELDACPSTARSCDSLAAHVPSAPSLPQTHSSPSQGWP